MGSRTLALALTALLLAPTLSSLAAAGGGGDWSLTASRVADGEDAVLLVLRTASDAPHANGTVTLHVNLTRADAPPAAWTEVAGERRVAPNANVTVPFHASRGNGTYLVDVVWETGHAGRGIARNVTIPFGAHANGRFTLDVDDAPTHLAYASDSVNDPGKSKYPGDALIARLDVEDANGLDAVPELVVQYARVTADGTRLVVNETVFRDLDAGDPNVTAASVEARFSDAPMGTGTYVENATARDANGSVLAGVERPFSILDTQPALFDGVPFPESVADRDRVVTATAALADRNLGTGPLDASSVPAFGIVTATIYRASRAVAEPGWAVALGDSSGDADPTVLDLRDVGHRDGLFPYRVEDAHGVFDVPVQVAFPRGATPGSYRVTLKHAEDPSDEDPRLLGTLPFEIAPLPRVSALAAGGTGVPGADLPVNVTIADATAARVIVRLLDGADRVLSTAERAHVAGEATLQLRVPGDTASGTYTLEALALARADSPLPQAGEPGHRTAPAEVDGGAPEVRVTPASGEDELRLGPRTPGRFNVTALNFTPERVTFTLVAPNGSRADAAARVVAVENDTYALNADGIRPGRYALAVHAEGSGGERADAEMPVRVLPWLGVRLPATPTPLTLDADGRLRGSLALAADGNVPVKRLVVLAGPYPDGRAVTGVVRVVDADGTTRAEAALASGRGDLAGDLLDAHEQGPRLEVDLDPVPGLDAGHHEVPVRVLIVPGGSR